MTETADVRRTPTVGGAMLSDASRAGNASPEWFHPQYWHGRGAASRAPGGRGTTLFVSDGSRHWVLRHYHRGGLVARVLADRYLWTGEANTRAFREWRLLAEMRAEGLPVPGGIESFDAAVVMSHHLPSDLAYLRHLARSSVRYVGLLGPAARRERLRQELGAAATRLEGRLFGPVGLDIGAATPETIALAIIAEIHAQLRGRDGRSYSVTAPR